MAGGRRPASYGSGMRHHSSIEHSVSVPPTHPATPPPPPTTSLPLWIPSIWQPSPGKSSVPPMQEEYISTPRRERPYSHEETSTALAVALDSAVKSAVVRALGNGLPPSPPHQSSTVSSDTLLDEDSAPVRSSRKERELTELVESLREQLNLRERDTDILMTRLDEVDSRIARTEAENDSLRGVVERLTSQLKEATDVRAESERKQVARVSAVRELARANQNAISKLRASQHSAHSQNAETSAKTKEVAEELNALNESISYQLKKSWAKIEQIEQSVRKATVRLDELESNRSSDASNGDASVDQIRRSVDDNVESIACLRSRLKRVESTIDEVSRQTTDSLAMTNGFEEGIRAGVVEIRTSVGALYSTVEQLQRKIPELCSGKNKDQASKAHVDKLESNIKALKKLIESNLRTQWNAESIVKEQVSLITKHVCVAMRQYTARRISENNQLIDQALRARIPEYAKKDEQFVLVREEDLDGNESVDIQRTLQITSTCASNALDSKSEKPTTKESE